MAGYRPAFRQLFCPQELPMSITKLSACCWQGLVPKPERRMVQFSKQSHVAGAAREVSHNRAAGHLIQNIGYCLCRGAPSWLLLDPWKSIIPPTSDSALGTERNSLPGIF